MVSHTANSRPASAVSPTLILAVIVLTICVVEALLVARFSLHLFAATASAGLSDFVLDMTRPLVAPFSNEAISPRAVGWVDRGTLLAAAVYLVAALVLMVVTAATGGLLAGKNVIANRRRRENLRRPRQATRLVGTASLSLPPDQAVRALRLLHLDSRRADLFVIPAEGGCIVAGFTSSMPRGGLLGLGFMRSTHDVATIRRTLAEIERRFQPAGTPGAAAPSVRPRSANARQNRPAVASNQ